MIKVKTKLLCLIAAVWGLICASHILSATGFHEICPIAEKKAIETWCKKTFQKNGNVTLGNHTVIGKQIECVCNNFTSIMVSVKANVKEGLPNGSDIPSPPGSPDKMICYWSGVFEDMPEGNYCTSMAGVNPSGCNGVDTSFCYTSSCNTKGDGYNMTCNTCEGRMFSIVKEKNKYTRTYSPPVDCSPEVNCTSHGCCNTQLAAKTDGPCTCYRDPKHGYWDGANCSVCLKGYKTTGVEYCTTPAPAIQVILSSLAVPMTMVLPNLLMMVVFVIIGRVRRLWDTDAPFRLTALRRTNLSTVQSARRGEASMFRSKRISRRPAKSQGFISDSQAPVTHDGTLTY
ncbi:unnamed protein product [Phytomonas sp. EM1]|nr:unnamed protein product [Phytomonas sp. EM1]|eukprot:CCW62234.1 unnamed protein product [Phytomonas sp. isolate EM1]